MRQLKWLLGASWNSVKVGVNMISNEKHPKSHKT